MCVNIVRINLQNDSNFYKVVPLICLFFLSHELLKLHCEKGTEDDRIAEKYYIICWKKCVEKTTIGPFTS